MIPESEQPRLEQSARCFLCWRSGWQSRPRIATARCSPIDVTNLQRDDPTEQAFAGEVPRRLAVEERRNGEQCDPAKFPLRCAPVVASRVRPGAAGLGDPPDCDCSSRLSPRGLHEDKLVPSAARRTVHALHRVNWQLHAQPRRTARAIPTSPPNEFRLPPAPPPSPGTTATPTAARLRSLDTACHGRARARRRARDAVRHRTPAGGRPRSGPAAATARNPFASALVAGHLLELYRFAEGLPFVKRATERDVGDFEAWTQLGRALANTGDEGRRAQRRGRAARGRGPAGRVA